jgi:pimeloyl-ACP methyl ester carboxylesterase
MASKMDIDGHPTWVEDLDGSGAPLLLLHGGMSNSDELLGSIGRGLSDSYRVVAFDRRGHGYTADTDADFHYADMANETIRVLEEAIAGAAHLVGWSDGGIIALLVALRRPDLVRKLVVIGTNFHYNGTVPVELDPESPLMLELGKAYIERSPDGAGHLDTVIRKSFAMLSSEPTLTAADIAQIGKSVLVVVGDDDIVALPHTVTLYEALPDSQLAVVPGASHALPLEQPDAVSALIRKFLDATEPPHTMFPVRRARPGNA